ncbi:MAG: hypothetical protein U7126_20240 [Microcoleus sp.]
MKQKATFKSGYLAASPKLQLPENPMFNLRIRALQPGHIAQVAITRKPYSESCRLRNIALAPIAQVAIPRKPY